jgi:four helix bundle protein
MGRSITTALDMHVAVAVAFRHIEDIRAWRLAYEFKMAIYRLTEQGSLSRDVRLRDQLREAAASAPSHVSEGFGRFDPADFARFVKMARGSVMECRNHLVDAVDRGHITADVRAAHDACAEEMLKETTGLLDYLQSPEARQNAERIRQRRIERRRARQVVEPGTKNAEPES